MAATYKDIRRLTGLSLATISKHFNGGNVRYANRALIEKAVRDLGYQVNDVARGLRSRRSMTVGVVLSALNSTFNTSIVAHAEEKLREAGYGTILCDARGSSEAEAEAVQFLIGKMVDGIVILPVSREVPALAAAAERGVPVVSVDSPVNGAQIDSVLLDNRAAVGAAVDLLVDAGHREIALVVGTGALFTMSERRSGFRAAITRRLGRPPRGELVRSAGLTIDAGHAAVSKLLALPEPPTAVVAANYELTLGAAAALNELPDDVTAPALVGFDNLELARVLRPKPTLVVQPIAQMAAQMADLLLERMLSDEQPGPRRVVLDAELIVGDRTTYAWQGGAPHVLRTPPPALRDHPSNQ